MDWTPGLLVSTVRRRMNLTQPELADRVGCHSQTLSNWERGVRPIPASSLPAIVRGLEMPEYEATLLRDLVVPVPTMESDR